MDKSSQPKKNVYGYFSGLIFPSIILLLSIVTSFWIWNQTKIYLHQQANDRFNSQITDISDEINRRFTLYTNGIIGVKGLFDAADTISQQEWNTYILEMNLSQNYPGATNIAFIRVVSNKDKQLFLHEIQTLYLATSSASIKLYPDSEVNEHYFYQYIGSNFNQASPSAVLGFDIGSDPPRLMALERARDTNLPTGTGVIFSITTKAKLFSTFLPIYTQKLASSSAIADQNSTEWRRKNLLGFAQISLQTQPFFESVLKVNPLKTGINLVVYDSQQINPDHLLFTTDKKLISQEIKPANYFSKTVQLPIVQRKWNLYFQAMPDFGANRSGKITA